MVCGLVNGQLGVADLRMSGPASVMLLTKPAAQQPLHSVLPLPQLCPAAAGSEGLAADCVVATTGGVFAWQQSSPDSFSLLCSPAPKQACESIAWEEEASLLAVSYRSALDGDGWGTHHILQPAGDGGPAAAAAATATATATATAEQQPQWQLRSKLWGHHSKEVMTRGAFVRPYTGAPVLFVSADEPARQPWLWGLQGGVPCGQLPGPFQSPVMHVQGGLSSSLGGLGVLAAASKERLALYSWQQACV